MVAEEKIERKNRIQSREYERHEDEIIPPTGGGLAAFFTGGGPGAFFTGGGPPCNHNDNDEC